MDIKVFREKVLHYCKIVDKSQKALAIELTFHPTHLSNKLNENDGKKLTNSEIKAIIKTLAKWEALNEGSEIIDLLDTRDLKLSIFTKEELSSYPLNNFKFELSSSVSKSGKSNKWPPNKLPAQANSLIGREGDVKVVRDILSGSSTRLLTLTGPGGTGKTRLSLQVGREVIGKFEHGVFFVELAAIINPDLVPQIIAQVLEVEETKGNPLRESLKNWLKDKNLLLILDNFEQVLGASIFIGELLITAPDLKILVTSREVLHIYGERTIIVTPLALPDITHLPAFEILPKYSAIALYIDRAQASKSNFTPNNENLTAISQICFLLDGLPLAIELVAARSNIYTPQALLSRLKRHRFSLTNGAPVDLPKRHQSLQNAIDWSFDLLNEAECELLIRLSIFPTNGSFDSIETICNVAGDLSIDFLEVLHSLVNKSLLKIVTDLAGEPRFGMLATVREYAFEKLMKNRSADLIKGKHAAYFLSLAEEAFQYLNKPEQGFWLNRLSQEHLNLSAAISNSLNMNDVNTALRLGAALGQYWQTRGYLTEGSFWLTSILERIGNNNLEIKDLTLLKAKAINMLALLNISLGEYTLSERQYNECLISFKELGYNLGITACYKGLGNIAVHQSDFAKALGYYEEGLEIHRNSGDKREIADFLNSMGVVAINQGDITRSRKLFGESLDLRREIGDQLNIANSLNNIAIIWLQEGEYGKALPIYEESLKIRRELGYKQGIAESLNNLGEVNYFLGNLDQSAEFLIESLEIHRGLGNKQGIGISLGGLSEVFQAQGKFDEALKLSNENLLLRIELRNKRGIGLVLEDFCSIARGKHKIELAVKLFSFSEKYHEEIGFNRREIDRSSFEKELDFLRNKLSKSEFIMLWEEGSKINLDEITNLVTNL